MNVCIYCGARIDKGNVCVKCHQKRPLVRELFAICQEIKKYKENRNGTSKIR